MAEIRQKVLLIDGDLRRPRLHKVFGVSNDSGLGNLLRTGTPLEATPITNLVCKTKIPGLYLLPGGTSPISPSILLNSPRMSGLLDCLRREFDMVLVDAPPVIHLADARVLGRFADGVVLVIRSGQTTPASVMSACKGFLEDGTRMLGIVLNGWDPKTGRHYGSYHYEAYGGQ
jgi:capsular exopolysaccharide synthesis family protein